MPPENSSMPTRFRMQTRIASAFGALMELKFGLIFKPLLCVGRKAKWLLGEDYDRLLAEPLDRARARLGIGTPTAYLAMKKG